MKALITGVTGFAGSFLAEHLLECGDEVRGCSSRGRWPAHIPPALIAAVPLLPWDLSQAAPPGVQDALDAFAPEVVYHLAGLSVPADCGRDRPTAEAEAANVAGTRAVILWASSLARPPRLVFSSSCYVYAPVRDDDPCVAETAPVKPRGGYALTKLEAELQLLRAFQRNGLKAVIARSFQHTGPRQSTRMMVPDWAQQLVQPHREPIRVVCLDTFLDLCDVRDVVRAYRQLALQGRSGEVYNVGSGVCRRSGDIFEEMRQLCDPRRAVIELAPGRRQHPVAETAKLAACTAWRPTVPLAKTLRDTLDFWQQRMSRR